MSTHDYLLPAGTTSVPKYAPKIPMREINTAEGEILKQQIDAISYFETSAATGVEVNAAFEQLAQSIKEKM